MNKSAIIQKAFNAGYLIEKYLPKLFKLLVEGFQNKSNPYVEAFSAGGQEFEKEQMKSSSSPLSEYTHKVEVPSKKTSPDQLKDAPEDDLEL